VLLNVLDFATEQTALDQAEDGDAVYFPGVKTYTPPAGGYQIEKSLEIFGDGPADAGDAPGTRFLPGSSGGDIFVVSPAAGDIASVRFRDFKITIGQIAGDCGIKCVPGTDRKVGAIRLERVNVFHMATAAFCFDASASGAAIEMISMIDCAGTQNGGLGALFKNVRSARLVRCVFVTNELGGIRAEESGMALYMPSADDNGADANATQGQMLFLDCSIARVDTGQIEKFAGKTVAEGCTFDGSGGAAAIEGANFTEVNPSPSDAVGIKTTDGPVMLLPNRFARVKPILAKAGAASSDVVMLQQFNDPTSPPSNPLGHMVVPEPNHGMIASPFVRRDETLFADDIAGLSLPADPSTPSVGLMDGMLYFATVSSQVLVRVAGAWKVVGVE